MYKRAIKILYFELRRRKEGISGHSNTENRAKKLDRRWLARKILRQVAVITTVVFLYKKA